MMLRLLMLLLIGVLAGCASLREGGVLPPLETVAAVDLQRYAGTWYEIARYPNRFQDGCESDSTATYRLLPNGELEVLNRCSEGIGRKPKEAKGRARVVDGATNARLKVSFRWPFEGDYWIIDLASDYSYAVVAAPSRRYLWILSRQPQLDQRVYVGILQRIRAQGFDPNLLVEGR